MAVNDAAAQTAVELKFGQVGVASASLRITDADVLQRELELRIAAAPNLFARAPLILDLSRLPELPDAGLTRALLDSVRRAGMLPVGLSYGTAENEQLAKLLNLPLFAKFRVAPDRAETQAPPAPREPQVDVRPAAAPAAGAGQHHAKPVRSGQQIYARGRDLVVNATVGSGAEIIADGSIHVYGRLAGRAVAGAHGDASARIYCQDFQAELVSIAGHYRVFEEVPADLRGKPVQAWLEGERLVVETL
jgi:septum site-determining protein MinC